MMPVGCVTRQSKTTFCKLCKFLLHLDTIVNSSPNALETIKGIVSKEFSENILN